MSFPSSILQVVSANGPLWVVFAATGILLFGFVRRQKLLVQIPGPPNGKWLSGHFRSLGGPNGIKFQEKLLSEYGFTMKLNGPLGEEFIFTADPACMHTVLVKDKTKFERVKGASLMIRWVFGGGLLALQGEEHRAHRKLLNPVFTMKFLRELMPIFMDIAKQTSEGIKGHLTKAETCSGVVDVFPWATVAALELIGEAGLGYSFNSFTGERNEYNESIKIIVPFFSKIGPFLPILAYLYRLGTPSLRRWVLDHISFLGFRKLLHAMKVQNTLAEEVLQARQTLIASGHDLSSEAGRGRDIMTLLMKANEKEGAGFRISRQEMVGHMNVFIFAGHETTSGAISRLLDTLANHQSIQVKLREEIQQYFSEHPDDAYHDDLLELPYLDAVVRETLRLYEPVVGIRRVCLEDTTLPLTYPINTPTGTITSLPIKKGTRVLLSVTMANHSKAIWGEQALEFWPERWIGNKLDEVTQPGAHLPGVYSAMMTFGAGHQACIGFKFAIMEIKVMVTQLIQDFKFELCNEEFAWEPAGVQQPFLKKDPHGPTRLPALPLKVTRL